MGGGPAAAVAVGLTPGVLVVSAGAFGWFLLRLVPRRGEVRQKPSAGQPRVLA
jgi:hypothetical protein